ncbi:MAG TPA: YfiR family protein [Burkholderiales bacterium]|jgi:hypothetical protein
MDVLRSVLAGVLVAIPCAALAQASPGEVEIKAAFLYKFGSFIDWPPAAFPSPAAPFEIGVVGADALAAELERVVSERTVQGRPVLVRRLGRGDSLAGLHALFVGRSEGGRLGEILEGAKGRPLLVVTDSPEGAPPPGSMINFVAENDRLRFDVALPAAEQSGLRISSRLLAVARKVIES